MKKTTSCLQTAMGLLARREHSRKELREKLKIRQYNNCEIEDTLNDLQNRNLQSDERFAECYARSRAAKGFGPLKIKYELQEKGIETNLAHEIIDNNSSSWMENLARTYHKKFGKSTPENFAERNKQINYLIYKGYSLEQIKSFFQEN